MADERTTMGGIMNPAVIAAIVLGAGGAGTGVLSLSRSASKHQPMTREEIATQFAETVESERDRFRKAIALAQARIDELENHIHKLETDADAATETEATIRERLAALESDREWLKEWLGRLETKMEFGR